MNRSILPAIVVGALVASCSKSAPPPPPPKPAVVSEKTIRELGAILAAVDRAAPKSDGKPEQQANETTSAYQTRVAGWEREARGSNSQFMNAWGRFDLSYPSSALAKFLQENSAEITLADWQCSVKDVIVWQGEYNRLDRDYVRIDMVLCATHADSAPAFWVMSERWSQGSAKNLKVGDKIQVGKISGGFTYKGLLGFMIPPKYTKV